MHISLDAALQRQPLLSTVGDKLLPSFPGAAAAYSLRALNGDANNVVNVRRDGDDGERDFTAEGVALELENWVNGKLETTLPADVATAAAAYSLRKVRNDYSGNAVQIRRASDDVEVNVAFDSNGEVSTSSAITNVDDLELINASSFPTDSGGFSATSGSTFSFGETLDGKSDVLFASFDGSGTFGLSFPTSDVAIGDVVKYSFEVYWASTNIGGLPDLRIRSGVTTIGHTDVPMPSEDSWYTFSGQFTVTSNTPTALTLIAANSSGLTTGDVFAIANGSYDKQQDAGDTTATTLGEFLTEATPARNRTGPARYDTFTPDGVTGFTAITNNIAAGGFDIAGASGTDVQVSFDITLNSGTVTVSLRPAFETGSDVSNSETITTSGSKSFTLTATGDYKAMLFITASADYVISNFSVNVPYNHDATVVTWYDQSGNNKHLSQDTTGNQPKIAEGGSLLTLGGKPTIKPDGTATFLQRIDSYWESLVSSDFSVFVAANKTSDFNAELIAVGNVSTEDPGFDFLMGGGGVTDNPSYRGAEVNVPFTGVTFSGMTLFSAIDSDPSTNGNAYINGSDSFGTPAAANRLGTADRLTLFARRDGNSYYDGEISEVIIYASNQHDNRFKIESNINNHFGIYTAAYNGFVETWYDQSGNGRHAEQLTTDDQPRIVSNGSYLGELDFDGNDDALTFTGPATTAWSLACVCDIEGATGGAQGIFGTGGAANKFELIHATVVNQLLLRTLSSNDTSVSLAEPTGKILVWSNTSGDGTINLAVDGGALSSNTGHETDFSVTAFSIGKTDNDYLDGQIMEVVFYNSDQFANRTGIESNIADEYGITLS